MSAHGTAASDPRPPTQREREILDFLLSPDVPGVAELREQARTALIRTWDCGCVSFEILVDRENTSPSSLRSHPAIDASASEGVAPERLHSLMLWVDEDGWLSSLEVVDVADDHGEFNPIPPPSMYEPPRIGTQEPQADPRKGLAKVVARLLGRKP
jgi:hypothetical protein